MKRFLTVIVIMTLLIAETSYAASYAPKEPGDAGKSIAELNGRTEEEWAAITDGRLEYDEIRDRVHFFNPDLSFGWDQYDDSVRKIKNSVTTAKRAKKDSKELFEEFQDADSAMGLAAISGTAKSLEKTLKKMERSVNSYNSQLRNGENTLTAVVEGLMLTYGTIRANRKTAEKLLRCYEETCSVMQQMEKEGMSTRTDVLKAKTDAASAKSTLSSLKQTESQLYDQLRLLCGWSLTDEVVIGDIPKVTEAELASVNPEADFEEARGYNATISSARSSAAKGDTAKRLKEERILYLEDNLRNNLDSLKSSVDCAVLGVQAAGEGMKAAEITRKAADSQFRDGMISRAEYLGAQVQYLQKEAALNMAEYSLRQAVVDYRNAVQGTSDVS